MNFNSFELLLQNKELLQRPQKRVKIPRLSKGGVDFTLTCEALTVEAQRDINEKAHMNKVNPNDGVDVNKVTDLQVYTVMAGVVEFDPQRNKEHIDQLKQVLNFKTIKEMVEAILLPGEIGDLYIAITELSGGAEDVVDEIKNE